MYFSLLFISSSKATQIYEKATLCLVCDIATRKRNTVVEHSSFLLFLLLASNKNMVVKVIYQLLVLRLLLRLYLLALNLTGSRKLQFFGQQTYISGRRIVKLSHERHQQVGVTGLVKEGMVKELGSCGPLGRITNQHFVKKTMKSR